MLAGIRRPSLLVQGGWTYEQARSMSAPSAHVVQVICAAVAARRASLLIQSTLGRSRFTLRHPLSKMGQV